ncbi:MAG: S-layer homology domain-containing protein [Leptolyngbyaceae cyanobacterium]
MRYSIHQPLVFVSGLVAIALSGSATGTSSQPMAQLPLPDVEPVHLAAEIPELSQAIIPDSPGSDISPSHWSYAAVDNLVTNYGCLNGYPDGSFRGDQAISRYEFAAALNSCLNALLESSEQGQGPVLDEILADLNRLQTELGDLSSDIDTLEE